MPISPEHLRRNGFFKTILFNSGALEEVCSEYLLDNMAPNVAGLCAHLGTTPYQLRSLFTQYEELSPTEKTRLGNKSGSPNPNIPSESNIQYLANVIMHIEADIVGGGLTGRFNAHMTKFILSAFHDRHEKSLTESKSDNSITVHLKSHQPTTLEELKEYQRLEAAIADEQAIELAAMGKAAPEGGRYASKDDRMAPSRDDSPSSRPLPLEDPELVI